MTTYTPPQTTRTPHNTPQPTSVAKLQRELDELKQRAKWQSDVLRSPELSASEKVTLLIAAPLVGLRQKLAGDKPTVRLSANHIGDLAGLSSSTVSRNIRKLEAAGAWQCEPEPLDTGKGYTVDVMRVRPLPALDEPTQLQRPPDVATHGGKRDGAGRKAKCTNCPEGTPVTKKTRRIESFICSGCGETLHEEELPAKYAPVPNDEPTRNQDDYGYEDDEAAAPAQLATVENNQQARATCIPTDDAAATFLAHLAGNTHRRLIVMGNSAKGAKYTEVTEGSKELTPAMALAHLEGKTTYGTTMARHDGMTLSVPFDGDAYRQVEAMLTATPKLRKSGAYVLMEVSPVKTKDNDMHRARLEVFFAEYVNAADAHATILHHAPELAICNEYWPNAASANATRLPFAFYRRGVNKWCEVLFPSGQPLHGMAACRRVLAEARTPATWVTQTAQVEPAAQLEPCAKADATPRSLVISTVEVAPDAQRTRPAALDDATWQAKYGDKPLLYAAFIEKYTAAWFNAKHRVEDMVTPNKQGKVLATWRGDKNPNVVLTKANGFVDYSTNATVEAGDALELHCLLNKVTRDKVLADTAGEIAREALRELEAAAKAGRGLPQWVHEITTLAGWRHYDALRDAATKPTVRIVQPSRMDALTRQREREQQQNGKE